MPLVAGIDSSTQSCKVLVCDGDTGEIVRSGTAPHPDGTEIDPQLWWAALQTAVDNAGGLDDVAAVSVGAQQHGMVCLDEGGEVVRDALLWNDTRSSSSAAELVDELGGAAEWAKRIGVVPVAAITASKLRWLADHEPDHAAATAAVCLPHDWLTWRLTRLDRYRRAVHRPQRRQRDRLLLRRNRHLPTRSARAGDAGAAARRCRRCSAHTTPPARTPERSRRSVPARVTTPRRRWGSAPNRATASSRSARPAW